MEKKCPNCDVKLYEVKRNIKLVDFEGQQEIEYRRSMFGRCSERPFTINVNVMQCGECGLVQFYSANFRPKE